MKKYIGAAFLLLSFNTLSHAVIDDPLVIQGKTVVVHLSTTVPAATVAGGGTQLSIFDLVSLSTTSGLFPHQDTGEIDISAINLFIDKLATSSGSVKIGVINYISESSGSVTFIYNNSYLRNINNTGIPTTVGNFAPAFYETRVRSGATATITNKDGSTPYILSNDLRSGSGLYTSTTNFNSPLPGGNVKPRTGDIVMEAVNNDISNSYNLAVDIWYHSERP